jgi:hypothetical protein
MTPKLPDACARLHTRRSKFLVVSVLAGAAFAFGQSGGRFDGLKRQAIGYLDSNQYDRAAGKLEEVWEQDQSDSTVAEELAVAYLNGEDRAEHPDVEGKARVLLDQLVRGGERASFLVQHSHEKLTRLQGGSITDYCSGRLSIVAGKVTYVAQARKGVEPHSFSVALDEVQIKGPDNSGSFHLKTKAKDYTMIARSRVKSDGALIVGYMRQASSSK